VGVVLGVALGVALGVDWREGAAAAGGKFFLARGKEIARRKEITDALKREQTYLYFRAQSSSQTNYITS
jgi:hypothetical protein